MNARSCACVAALVATLGCGSGGSSSEGAGGTSSAPSSSVATGGGVVPTVTLPRQSLSASELGVLVNPADPQSVAVAAHYVAARGIPPEHVYEVPLPLGAAIAPEDFSAAKSNLDAAVDPKVQAYAITWTQPYRVGCMSVTAAFALGFDTAYCNTSGQACGPTAAVPYFDSDSLAPFSDHGIRPTMAIVGSDAASAIAVIDRGVAADATFPTGDGYFVRTTDVARSVRWPDFKTTTAAWSAPGGLSLSYLDNSDGSGMDAIADTKDVLFYFTGLVSVPSIETNTFLPGAIADHLTSFGGEVPTSSQMSIARWLEVGATASYGTVVEPCNFTTKFPSPKVLLPHYFRGETVIEAYWKSVRWPGEGLFIGEPLARPWGTIVTTANGALTIETTTLNPMKTYEIAAGPGPDGPFEVIVSGIEVPNHQRATLTVDPATAPHYVLRETP